MASSSEAAAALRMVGDLDVAPAPEPAVVVDRGAPLVAGGVAFAAVGPGALLAARDLDDQRALDVAGLGDEADEEVGDVVVAAALVDVGDREAEVVVLDVGRDVVVELEVRRRASAPRCCRPCRRGSTWLTCDFSAAGPSRPCG